MYTCIRLLRRQPLQRTRPTLFALPGAKSWCPSTRITEVSTILIMKDRILATCQTSLSETRERIEAAETAERDLRRQLEDQLIRTLLPSQDVMIPARRVYAILASVSQTYSSLAYAVDSAIQDRNP